MVCSLSRCSWIAETPILGRSINSRNPCFDHDRYVQGKQVWSIRCQNFRRAVEQVVVVKNVARCFVPWRGWLLVSRCWFQLSASVIVKFGVVLEIPLFVCPIIRDTIPFKRLYQFPTETGFSYLNQNLKICCQVIKW